MGHLPGIRMPGLSPATYPPPPPTMIQFLVNVHPGGSRWWFKWLMCILEAAGDGSSGWVPDTRWKVQMGFLAPSFGRAQPWPLWAFEKWTNRWKLMSWCDSAFQSVCVYWYSCFRINRFVYRHSTSFYLHQLPLCCIFCSSRFDCIMRT